MADQFDRRERSDERRALASERRSKAAADRRARHQARPWMSASFGAHILGLIHPEDATPDATTLARAYAQPEAKAPLRPRDVRVV